MEENMKIIQKSFLTAIAIIIGFALDTNECGISRQETRKSYDMKARQMQKYSL